MKKSINFCDFCDFFSNSRKDTFSYKGKKALFEYLEQYEDDTGEELELDIVALCSEYTEYRSAVDAASNYYAFEGKAYLEGDFSEEEKEEKAMEFLYDNTQVINFEGGVIIQDF